MLTPLSWPAVIALTPSSATVATRAAPRPRAREVRPRRPGRRANPARTSPPLLQPRRGEACLARASRVPRLIRVLVREDAKERDQDDLDVEGEVPVLDVVQ